VCWSAKLPLEQKKRGQNYLIDIYEEKGSELFNRYLNNSDTFSTLWTPVPGDESRAIAISRLAWSFGGSFAFDDNQVGPHTASFYADPANWTVQNPVPMIAGTQQGETVNKRLTLGDGVAPGDVVSTPPPP